MSKSYDVNSNNTTPSMDSDDLIIPLIEDSPEFNSKFKNTKTIVSEDYAEIKIPQNNYALTTFLLLNTMIGSGILNQAFVFEHSGLIGGCIGFLFASALTWFGLILLTDVGIKCHIFEFSGLAKHAFGSAGEFIIDMSIIIVAFGAQLGYILIVGETLAGLLQSWGCLSILCSNNMITILSVIFLVTPFCLFRYFGHLAWLSIFSIVTISSVLLLVVIGGPERSTRGHINLFNLSGMIQSIGSIVFSLNCASANFQAFISTEKKCRNKKSWRWITGVAVIVGSLMCMIMGLVGYASFKSGTKGEILDNFEGHAFDFFKAMVVVHLILYIPVNFVIMRYSIVNMFLGVKSEDLSAATHTALSVALLALVTGIVLALTNMGMASGAVFGLILDLTGGIGGSLNAFILPAAIYLKLMSPQYFLYKAAGILLVLGFLIMIAVVTITMISIVQ